jgi:phosphoglycerate dehydrogenase-like enzyme
MAERFRVLVTDFLDETTVEEPILGDVADIVLARAHAEADLLPHLADADALIVYHDIPFLGEAVFGAASRCKVTVRAGVGYNNICLKATGSRGIPVCNVPDYGSEEVADHAIMMMLAVARRLIASHESMRRGEWDYKVSTPAPRLRGKTFGVVGCGRIGTATALRAKAFGMDVVFYDPNLARGYDKALGIRRADSLAELLEQSHVVSLHCYLDAGSRHLINADAFAKMRDGAILINTARGPVVDQEALVAALAGGKLTGVGLDVFEREPLDEDRLRVDPRVLMTPHSAFYSDEGFVEMRRKTAEEVRRVLLGETPWNLVNREHLVAR